MSHDHFPDLTVRPPRSPRVRLGNIAILPRALDKGRATIAGKNGEYHYNCPLDQRVLNFLGIDAEVLKAELASGKGDYEILQWVQANGSHQRREEEIAAWSDWAENRPCTSDKETVEFFYREIHRIAPERDDITSWFKLLDFDDFVTFGGKA